ncbi:MAG: hypothetical protein NZ838_12450 [Candidatus Marinimicrobia bacterium]|nr:hypothetical protein [Candidatus Neomarinimicrobiota bacterium]
MKPFKTLLVLSLLSVMFSAMACEDSDTDDTVPESATLSGVVTFSGTWPGTEILSISLNPTWPPTGAPYASKYITPAEIESDQYSYIFKDVAFGAYASISVSWMDPYDPNPMTNQHILGVYGGTAQAFFMDADSVIVSETNYEVSGLDFTATFGN